MIKFSILIPVYNVERYLDECIASVLNQNYTNYEMILIDDGSTDNSGKVCEKYNSGQVKVFHKKNEGLLLARRDAINMATGDYCIFLDSDDKLSKDCLSTLAELLTNKVDMVIYNLNLWEPSTNLIVERIPPYDTSTYFEGDSLKLIREKFLVNHELNNLVIKCVKTNILKNDPTDYRLNIYTDYGEDRLQSFHMFNECSSILYIPKALYFYRNNSHSITKSIKSFSKIKDLISVGVHNFEKMYSEKWGLNSKDIVESMAVNNIVFLKDLFMSSYVLIDSKEDRYEYLNENWKSLIDSNDLIFINSKKANRRVRVQVKAIIQKNFFILECILLVKRIKHRIDKR